MNLPYIYQESRLVIRNKYRNVSFDKTQQPAI